MQQGAELPKDSLLAQLRSKLPLLYGVAIALLIFISFWMGAGRRYLSFANPREDIVNLQRIEVDYHQLYPSLESKQTFAQSFDWWHEPWRADQWVGAYWRPLSMQAWWIESHLFGEDRSYNWMRVSLLLAALFDVLLFLFFWRLTCRRLFALVGLAIFVLPGAWIHLLSPLAVVPRISNADLLLVQGWKDQPDLFANCLIIAAMIFAFDRRYFGALICACLAPCFKESGLLVFPLVLAMVVYAGDFRRLPKWIYAAVASFFALYMFARWTAGPMVFHFHTHGGDAGAISRYTNAMLPLAIIALTSIGAAFAGLTTFGLILWRPRRLWMWTSAVAASLFVGVLLLALQRLMELDVAFAQFLLDGEPVLLFILWLLVTAAIIMARIYLKPAIFLAACAFFVAIPFAMVTGALEHVLTLARAFQAGYGACAALSVISVLWTLIHRRGAIPAT